MPVQRRKRAGARPGRLPPQLSQALRDEAELLAGLEDAELRIRAVGDAFAAFDDELARFAQVRFDAIRQLRDEGGWSYERLAEVSGLSKARVAQLCREVRGRRGRR